MQEHLRKCFEKMDFNYGASASKGGNNSFAEIIKHYTFFL